MAQKRTQYVKTANGKEKQLIASAADIVELNKIDGLNATNVQEAIEELKDISATGGVTGVKGENETDYRQGQVNITKDNIGLGNVTNDAQVKRTEMGANGGVATLDDNGKVPASQLPSYVDDVLEYASKGSFPSTGETGKIYVALDTGKTYRWGGTAYVEIAQGLALGETDSTAYAGSKGKKNADDIKALQEELETAKADIEDIADGTTKVKKAEETDKLAVDRKISIVGDATGETTFNGSADASINVTLANSGVTAGTYSVVSVDKKGRVTNGAQLVEWGTSGQTEPSASLAVGGLFFELIE